MCQIGLVIGFRGRIQLRTVFKSNYPLTSLSRQKIHIIRRCIPCQAMNWTWSDNRNFSKLAKTSGKLNFSSVGKHALKWLPAADWNHVNTSCGDTVKCSLDAGKSPIFWSQSPCTYIYVQESQRFWDFVRIYTYESTKGLSHKPWKAWLALSRFWSEIDWQFSDPRIVPDSASNKRRKSHGVCRA